ncbi:hypothetical protein M8R20_36955 [Pseudomonas sp. R2.Fl]|nr:hypothetical protein [Pseudomonas sp. R2.Fl]
MRTVSPRGVVTVTRHQAFDQPSYDTPVLIDQGQNLAERVGIDITRDVFGKPLSIRKRNAAGTLAVTRSYAYNANQELCRSVEPETGATLMGYDGAGNLAWSAAGLPATTACEANGTSGPVVLRKASRTYDARNRVKTLVFPDGRGNTTNTYTPDGLLVTTVMDNDGTNVVTTTYGYNRRRLPTSERMQWGSIDWPIGYAYTPLGHLASHTYPNGQTVAYAPNALGQPTQAGTYATGVQYYPNGGMKQFSYGNGIVHTMTQNARQLPARSTDCTVASTDCLSANKRLDLTYTYDAHGNVVQMQDYQWGWRSRSMSYDGLDRLTQATGPSFGTATYGYNALDNVTTLKVTAGSHDRDHTYHYDASNRLTSVTNTVGGATVVGLGYDVQGNLANKNGQVFNFDFGNRLRGVNGVASYVYDGHGRRVRDYTTASKYSLYSQAGQLMYANDLRKSLGTQYVYLNGSLVAFRESTGTVKYQHTDALGTPVAVTDAAKAIVQTSDYEPYGHQVSGPLTDGPGYTGHVQDAATGLTYMQQRYYDPLLGRFLSVDPVTAYSSPGANFNRYWYANNNPYKFTDPDGRKGKVAWLVELVGDGMRKIARLTQEQAVRARKSEQNIVADRKQVASQVETAANEQKGEQLRHAGHDLKDGGKGLPHYQTEGVKGHSFWGKLSAGALMVAGVLDKTAEAADLIDPSVSLTSGTPELDNHRVTWFGAYEQIDPNGPNYFEAERARGERMKEQERINNQDNQ